MEVVSRASEISRWAWEAREEVAAPAFAALVPQGTHRALLAALDHILLSAQEHPQKAICPEIASWVASQMHLQERDRFFVHYGHAPKQKIAREADHLRSLALALGMRGYRLEKDPCTSATEWRAAWASRKAVGVLWRGHGWFAPPPSEAGSLVVETPAALSPYKPVWGDVAEAHRSKLAVSRVWSGHCHGEPAARIFAHSWRKVVGEGLAFLALGACGSGGAWDEEETNSLQPLGDPQDLYFLTYDVALAGSALDVFTHRGYVVTDSYRLQPAAWWTAARLAPKRSLLAREDVGQAYAEAAAWLAQAGHHPQDREALTRSAEAHVLLAFVLSRRGVDLSLQGPLTWAPGWLAFEAPDPGATAPDDSVELYEAATFLARRLDGAAPPPPNNDVEAWTAWWYHEETQVALEAAALVEEVQPEEGWVWAQLRCELRSPEAASPGQLVQGLHLARTSETQRLRCLFASLGPWRLQDDGELSRETEQTLSGCEEATSGDTLRLTYDPDTQRLKVESSP